MKTRLYLLLAILLIPILAKAEDNTSFPEETLLLYIPNNDKEWKEISRYVTEEEGIVELIPCSQTRKNWSELIAIQFFKKDSFNERLIKNIDKALDTLSGETLKTHNKASWKLLEKNENNALYEWKLPETSSNPTQHTISRIYISENGFHQIGITVKYRQMCVEERKKWIQILREYVELIPMNQTPLSDQYYSLDNTFDHALEVEPIFPWYIDSQYSSPIGYTATIYNSPNSRKNFYEVLTAVSMPTYNDTTIDPIYKAGISKIQKELKIQPDIKILEKTPDEIIYTYNHPEEKGLQYFIITRSFLTPKGFYSLTFTKAQKKSIDENELLFWKEKLKQVKVTPKISFDEIESEFNTNRFQNFKKTILFKLGKSKA